MKTKIETRLKRLRIYGFFGLFYSLYLAFDYFYLKAGIWELIIGACLFGASLIFVISSFAIKKK